MKNQKSKEMSNGCFAGFLIFFLFISIVLIIIGNSYRTNTAYFLKYGKHTIGEVVAFRQEKHNPTNTRQFQRGTAPVVEFVHQSDTFYIYSEQYSDLNSLAIGDEVSLFYLIDNPEKSIIDTWSEKWGAAAIFFSLSGIFGIISLASLLELVRKQIKKTDDH